MHWLDCVRTELVWMLGYSTLWGVFYLFHAPFRSHVTVRSDWYARITRITQLWSLVVLFLFHCAPFAVVVPGPSTSADTKDRGDAKLVFFPVFLCMTLVFSFLHKVKRRLHMAVTYGAGPLNIVLNSLVIAALCTAHHVYGQHVLASVVTPALTCDAGGRAAGVRGVLREVIMWPFCSSSATVEQWHVSASLITVGLIIVYADYAYKKRCAHDPHAGLLWSDVYEVTKRPADGRVVAVGRDRDRLNDFRYEEPPLMTPCTKAETQEPLTFSLSTDALRDIVKAKYPVNRPAMVSWLSAFAVGAYIKAGLTQVVSLVTSEVRSAELNRTPKVFSLSFSSHVQTNPHTDDKETAMSADQSDVWFDWIGDVGDGFNPTYDMARLLAQPRLRFASKLVHEPNGTAAQENANAGPTDFSGAKSVSLPRGSFVVIGGDLAYPAPTEETYTTRLFEPYRDALSGSPQLRKLFHARQMELVQPDESDPDLAHMHLLDAETVASMACGADTLRASRGTAEDALHSVPLLFAIPGNHDWFDGLRTFRKYIMEKTWIGGWLMPQRSSFFVLRLPYNWFMLCCDTGNEQDIDVAQRNYFLDVIEKYMDASSCVILSCHEPGWIQDSWSFSAAPSQPQIARVAAMLGTRLRLRLAGDIHNYTRHMPTATTSPNPVLVTSGGGGAFMHEPTRGDVVAFGENYTCAMSFPPSATLFSFLPKLMGFRVNNWKFDILIGVVCFLFVMPVLLTPPLPLEKQPILSVGVFCHTSVHVALQLFTRGLAQCGASLAVFLSFFGAFLVSTSTGAAPMYGRLAYSMLWTLGVSAVCFVTLAILRCLFEMMQRHNLLVSTQTPGSLLESHTLAALRAFLSVGAVSMSWCTPIAWLCRAALSKLELPAVVSVLGGLLRCFDPFEMLAFTTVRLRQQMAQTTAAATHAPPSNSPLDEVSRHLIAASFYGCYLLFHSIIVIPTVSFIIGCFLFFTTKLFQGIGVYDAAYSALQIEDFKSFVRFKIDHRTRTLHGYTIGVRRVPKLWVRDERFVQQYTSETTTTVPPPHLQRYPSRWVPSLPEMSRQGNPSRDELGDVILPWDRKSAVIDQFVCFPHDVQA